MKISAGNLDRRIQLQSSTPTNDTDTNELIDGWSTYATVWGMVEYHQNALEGDTTGRRYAGMDLFITIRWRSDIDPKHRVVFDSQNYTIEGEPREIGRREFLKIKVRRVE